MFPYIVFAADNFTPKSYKNTCVSLAQRNLLHHHSPKDSIPEHQMGSSYITDMQHSLELHKNAIRNKEA